MTATRCAECRSPVIAKGLCRKHYDAQRLGDLLRVTVSFDGALAEAMALVPESKRAEVLRTAFAERLKRRSA